MKLHVDWVRDAVHTGYGQMGLGLQTGLEFAGHQNVENSGLRVVCAPPYALKDFPKGQELWCYTMFESTRIPESFLEHIDNFVGVLCPNEYNVEQFSEFNSNVQLCEIGIDPKVWFPTRRGIDKELRFLHLGKGLRKGSDLVEEFFDLAFPNPENLDPVPVLARHPVGGRLSEADVVKLYHGSHIYLAPSRGEGWNLLAFQALATGMPTILTDIPGHAGFSRLPGALPCGWDSSDSIIGGAANWWAGYWWEPRKNDFVDTMRDAYEHYRVYSDEAMDSGFEIWKNKTWNQMGEDFIRIVGDWQRPDPSSEMVLATPRVFEVTVVKEVVGANIGDAVLNLPVGKAFVTADQMRVLQTAGYVEGTGNWMHMWQDNDQLFTAEKWGDERFFTRT